MILIINNCVRFFVLSKARYSLAADLKHSGLKKSCRETVSYSSKHAKIPWIYGDDFWSHGLSVSCRTVALRSLTVGSPESYSSLFAENLRFTATIFCRTVWMFYLNIFTGQLRQFMWAFLKNFPIFKRAYFLFDWRHSLHALPTDAPPSHDLKLILFIFFSERGQVSTLRLFLYRSGLFHQDRS